MGLGPVYEGPSHQEFDSVGGGRVIGGSTRQQCGGWLGLGSGTETRRPGPGLREEMMRFWTVAADKKEEGGRLPGPQGRTRRPGES